MLSVGPEPRWHSRQTVKQPEMAQAHIILCAHMIVTIFSPVIRTSGQVGCQESWHSSSSGQHG